MKSRTNPPLLPMQRRWPWPAVIYLRRLQFLLMVVATPSAVLMFLLRQLPPRPGVALTIAVLMGSTALGWAAVRLLRDVIAQALDRIRASREKVSMAVRSIRAMPDQNAPEAKRLLSETSEVLDELANIEADVTKSLSDFDRLLFPLFRSVPAAPAWTKIDSLLVTSPLT